MLKAVEKSYNTYYDKDRIYFKERLDVLRKDAYKALPRYINDEVPLFVSYEGSLRHVTMSMIGPELADSCSKGKSFVEYKVHKHLYPGYKFDNISFLTGKYYMYYKNDGGFFREIPGAPSYVEALRAKLPGFIITFREIEYDNGILRVELP